VRDMGSYGRGDMLAKDLLPPAIVGVGEGVPCEAVLRPSLKWPIRLSVDRSQEECVVPRSSEGVMAARRCSPSSPRNRLGRALSSPRCATACIYATKSVALYSGS